MKKVVYLGLEKCDFVYHMASSLSAIHRVLVCDNSFSGDLFSTVNREEGEFCSWLGIDFARNISASHGVDAYDYIMIYAGERMEDEYLSYEDVLFIIMPQCSHHGLQIIRDMRLPLEKIKHIVIMRDHFSKGMNAKTISTLLDLPPTDIAGSIGIATEDLGAYLSLTHSGRQNPKTLSPDMREALVYVLSVSEDTDRKTALLLLDRSWRTLKKRLYQEKKQEKQERKQSRKEKRHGDHG